MLYREQIQTLKSWSSRWGSSEQVCAIFSLAQLLTRDIDKKFVYTILKQLANDVDEDTRSLEGAANNSAWSERLLQEDAPKIATALIDHLPLVTDHSLSARYMDLLSKVLMFSIKEEKLLEDSRQLLSIAIIHPIFKNDQRDLEKYAAMLQSKMIFQEQRDEKIDVTSSDEFSEDDDFSEDFISTSDSDDHCEYTDIEHINTFLDPDSGMEDVPNWLKSLRLHKYQYLFAKLTYEDMLGLTEEKLAEQNVTKGARKKIASSVSRLRFRADKLREIEKDIPTYGSALSAIRLRERLKEMKEIIETPLKRPVGNDEDLPGLFTNALGKLYANIHFYESDEENLKTFVTIAEDAMRKHCLSEAQRGQIRNWHEKIFAIYQHIPKRKTKVLSIQHRRISSRGNGMSRGKSRHMRGISQPATQGQNMSLTWSNPYNNFNNSAGSMSPNIFHKRASSLDVTHLIHHSANHQSQESLIQHSSQQSLSRPPLSVQPSLQSSTASLSGDYNNRFDQDPGLSSSYLY